MKGRDIIRLERHQLLLLHQDLKDLKQHSAQVPASTRKDGSKPLLALLQTETDFEIVPIAMPDSTQESKLKKFEFAKQTVMRSLDAATLISGHLERKRQRVVELLEAGESSHGEAVGAKGVADKVCPDAPTSPSLLESHSRTRTIAAMLSRTSTEYVVHI